MLKEELVPQILAYHTGGPEFNHGHCQESNPHANISQSKQMLKQQSSEIKQSSLSMKQEQDVM